MFNRDKETNIVNLPTPVSYQCLSDIQLRKQRLIYQEKTLQKREMLRQTNKTDKSHEVNYLQQGSSVHSKPQVGPMKIIGQINDNLGRKLRGVFAKIDWAQVDHYMDGFS